MGHGDEQIVLKFPYPTLCVAWVTRTSGKYRKLTWRCHGCLTEAEVGPIHTQIHRLRIHFSRNIHACAREIYLKIYRAFHYNVSHVTLFYLNSTPGDSWLHRAALTTVSLCSEINHWHTQILPTTVRSTVSTNMNRCLSWIITSFSSIRSTRFMIPDFGRREASLVSWNIMEKGVLSVFFDENKLPLNVFVYQKI